MANASTPHIPTRSLSRREFLYLASLSTALWAAGCATDPVTGKSELMLVSESMEIDIDKKNSPHQFSTDYGISQDRELNSLDGMGRIEASANQYNRYLQSVKEGVLAKHAYQRLAQWGYIR